MWEQSAVCLIALAAFACGAWADGPEPIHVWHFDEGQGDDLLDAAEGDFVDLHLHGGAKRVEGRFGGAIQTGDGGYAQGEGIGHMDRGAVELWARPDQDYPGYQFGFIGFGHRFSENNDMALLGIFPAAERGDPAQFGFGICPGTWDGARAESPPLVGEWHHLAANWGEAGIEVFVDGEQVAASDCRFAVPSHGAVFLGASSWGRTFGATIDEVRVYAENLPAEVVAQHAQDPSYVEAPPQPTDRAARYGAAEGGQLDAADFASPESFTGGIQEAIDALPRCGGEVYIPPGTWLIRRSIWIPDNVTLRGAGASTVLIRPSERMTKLTAAAGAGDTQVQVEDASAFEVGADVSVYADRVHGWHSTTAYVQSIEGSTVTLHRGLNKPVDPAANAAMINYFPMITAEHKRSFAIRDLCIDGGMGRPNEGVQDFTWAAIHLRACRDCRVESCHVRNWPSDGISVQGGRGATISGNMVENCRGHGMHPGTSLADSVWINNISRENGGDGLFFCMHVRHSVMTGNVLAENSGSGIGHVGGGGDKYNVVSSNTCVGNGRWGIQVIDGSDNVISANLCLNNSRLHPGQYPGIGVIKTTDTVVSGNRCLDDQEEKTQAAGIAEDDESDYNLFIGNQCRGNAGPGLQINGANSREQGNLQ